MYIDEHEAGALLRLLDRDPGEPSGVDIDRAMREGFRRRRARRTGGLSAAAVMTVMALVGIPVAIAGVRGSGSGRSSLPAGGGRSAAATSPSPTASKPFTSCVAQALPVPDGVTKSLVTAASPDASAVFGRSYPKSGSVQVLMWRGGTVAKIPVPGDDASIVGVNNAGVAIGISYMSGTVRAWVYRDGRVSGLPGSDGAELEGINEAGVIVGNRGDTALVWSSPTAQPTPLPVPAGAGQAKVSGVDADGSMVGSLRLKAGASGVERAYLWSPGGTGKLLPLPSGVDSNSRSFASSIRNGWVTGLIGGAAPKDVTGVLWNLRTGQIRTVTQFIGRPSAVNGSGWMVGIDAKNGALVTMEARQLPLPDLYPHQSGKLVLPQTISDDGTVIAGQSGDPATTHAVVWHCS